LWNKRSKEFTEYQKRLMETADPAASWEAAFPDLRPGNTAALIALDKELDGYLKSGRYAFYRVQADPQVHIRESPLGSADLHLYLKTVRMVPEDPVEREKRIEAEIEEAAAEDPGHPLALLLLAKKDPVRLEAVRAAALARPTDYRSWLVLAGLEKGENETAVLRKAVELNPDSAWAANELAWNLVLAGKAKEALPIANRALDLNPGDGNIADTLAEVALQLGKCREALALSRRATLARGETEKAKKRYQEFEARCAAPPAK
jgi:tetratricopeptide (TPR) repeat protein